MGLSHIENVALRCYMHMVVITEKLINRCHCRTETFWSFHPPPNKGTLPVSLLLNENLYSSVKMVFTKALLLSGKWPQYKVVKAPYQRNVVTKDSGTRNSPLCCSSFALWLPVGT